MVSTRGNPKCICWNIEILHAVGEYGIFSNAMKVYSRIGYAGACGNEFDQTWDFPDNCVTFISKFWTLK